MTGSSKTKGKAKAAAGKAADGKSILDRIVTSFAGDPEGSGYLEDCMSFDPDLNRRVPLRYRIIAKGLATRSGLDEVNEKLKASGCAVLYARNIWEASLIYAFSKGMSYSEWKELRDICVHVRERQEELSGGGYFTGSMSLDDIKRYVDENSDMESEDKEALRTEHLTRTLDDDLKGLAPDHEEFRSFLLYNLRYMSTAREKTRYYFCKYLYYYLDSCRGRYLEARRASGGDEKEAQAEIAAFKGLTKLTRKKMSDEEAYRLLGESGISFGEIFDAFNYFYFGYISLDWMEVLLEYYGSISSVPADERHQLAASLRKYDSGKYAGLSDDEVLALKQAELDEKEDELDESSRPGSEARNYQKDRGGENTIRKYIKGSLDIDRTTLICFLIFFGRSGVVPEEQEISAGRLNTILEECGFAALRPSDGFDYFVLQFLESDEPVDTLMETVTDYALDEENFFIYRMYLASRSAEEDLCRLM